MIAPTDRTVEDATLFLDEFRASITPLLQRAVNTNTAMPGYPLLAERTFGTLSLTLTAEIMLASDSVRITCCGTGDPETYGQLAKMMGVTAADQRDSKFMFVFSNKLDAALLRNYEQVLAGRTPRFVIGQTAVPTISGENRGPNYGLSPVAQFSRGNTSAGQPTAAISPDGPPDTRPGQLLLAGAGA